LTVALLRDVTPVLVVQAIAMGVADPDGRDPQLDDRSAVVLRVVGSIVFLATPPLVGLLADGLRTSPPWLTSPIMEGPYDA
jgi:hypothetical protein